MNQKRFMAIIIILIITFALLVGGTWYYKNEKTKTTTENEIITPPLSENSVPPPVQPSSLTPLPSANENAEIVMPIDTVILRVTQDGGLCPYGGCFSEKIVKSNGGWTMIEGEKEPKMGTIKKEDIFRIYKLANETNFIEIRKHLFTETCPSAYDGPHYVYTFLTQRGEEQIDSCITQIDENSPLFVEVRELLKKL